MPQRIDHMAALPREEPTDVSTDAFDVNANGAYGDTYWVNSGSDAGGDAYYLGEWLVCGGGVSGKNPPMTKPPP